MDLEWLHKCQKIHEEFFRQNNIEPKIIKGNDTDKSGISSANLVSNRQRWVREHPMEHRN